MKYGTVNPLLSGKACQTIVDCSGKILLSISFFHHVIVVNMTISFTVDAWKQCNNRFVVFQRTGELQYALQAKKK